MTFRLALPNEATELVFTQIGADGILRCNGEVCYSAGRFAGPQPFFVGHRTLRAAAQRWFLDRMLLLKAYEHDHGKPWPFMQKETYNAPSEPAAKESDGGRRERQVDARDPEEGRQGVHEGGQGRKAAKAQKRKALTKLPSKRARRKGTPAKS